MKGEGIASRSESQLELKKSGNVTKTQTDKRGQVAGKRVREKKRD